MGTVAESIWVVLKFGGFVGFTPFYDRKTGRFARSRIYSHAAFSFVAICLVYTTFIKFSEHLEGDSETIILYGLPAFVTALANLSVFYQLNLAHHLDLQLFFDKLDAIDSIFKVKADSVKYTTASFALVTFGFFGITSYDLIIAILTTRGELWYLRYFVNDRLQLYLTFILVLFERALLRAIELRYALLNETLAVVNFDDAEISMVLKTKDSEAIIAGMLEVHNNLGDLVQLFNKLFGWNVLFSMIQISIGLLGLINLYIYYYHDIIDLFIDSAWNIYITAQGVIVTRMCEHVAREGRKTVSVGYKVVHRYCRNQLLKEKLLTLAKQAVARQPTFSAAGFFKVDYSTLFVFANMLTSYVIVIVQFGITRN